MKKLLRKNGRFQLVKKENANLMINLKDYAKPRFKIFFRKKNALNLVNIFLNTKFEGGRHAKRVRKI